MNPLRYATKESHKTIEDHRKRSERRLLVSRARHASVELMRIDREERETMRDWAALPTIQDAAERVDARLKLHKVLDGLRERRRILLGEPLPGSRRAGTERRPVLPMTAIDVQPTISAHDEQRALPAPTEDIGYCANESANAAKPHAEPCANVTPTLPSPQVP